MQRIGLRALMPQSRKRPRRTAPQPPHKPINIDFPTAASIPAVSIMNAEPTGPVVPGAAAAAASNPNPPPGGAPASRHARRQTVVPAAPIAAQAAAARLSRDGTDLAGAGTCAACHSNPANCSGAHTRGASSAHST